MVIAEVVGSTIEAARASLGAARRFLGASLAALVPRRKRSHDEIAKPSAIESPQGSLLEAKRSRSSSPSQDSLTPSTGAFDADTSKNGCAVSAGEAPSAGKNATAEAGDSDRLGPKRHVALLMSFLGTRYSGMQSNPNARTIESELFAAMVRAGTVSAANSDSPSKIRLQRAARTDRGVHALGQVVDAKLVLLDTPEATVSAINTHLPDDIRVWSVISVSGSFCSHKRCDARIYQYHLPSYALAAFPENTWDPLQAYAKLTETAKLGSAELHDVVANDGAAASSAAPSRSATRQPTTAIFDSLQKNLDHEYRVNNETLEKFRTALKMYQGTFDYRNFTNRKAAEESGTGRYVISVTASDPYLVKKNNGKDSGSEQSSSEYVEWITVRVHGQSFIMHQIRKMVGLAIMVVKTNTPPHLIHKVLKAHSLVPTPKAPGFGLVLERCLFNSYNKYTESMNLGHPRLEFTGKVQDSINEFSKTHLMPQIMSEENGADIFTNWFALLVQQQHLLRYLNPEANIPDDMLRARPAEELDPNRRVKKHKKYPAKKRAKKDAQPKAPLEN